LFRGDNQNLDSNQFSVASSQFPVFVSLASILPAFIIILRHVISSFPHAAVSNRLAGRFDIFPVVAQTAFSGATDAVSGRIGGRAFAADFALDGYHLWGRVSGQFTALNRLREGTAHGFAVRNVLICLMLVLR
jgi:hypothetical protein